MRSIKEICVIGIGPSSSHTMGPANACKYILNKYNDIEKIDIVLYGSLAKTGKGHLLDYTIDKVLKDVNHKITFDSIKKVAHPNTMEIFTTTKPNILHEDRFVSIGGGSLLINDSKSNLSKEVYPEKNMNEILAYCDKNQLSLLDYVKKYEPDAEEYFANVVEEMKAVVDRGLSSEKEEMPGDVHVRRKAKEMYKKYCELNQDNEDNCLESYLMIAATAASEENACGNKVVCSPTCGSSGVLPAVVSYLSKKGYENIDIVHALMVGSLIGIVCKQNGSISGAEAGCQAEIGNSSAIGAAVFAAINGLSNKKITLAAEMVIEQSLGLTCDAIEGRVQIPCINRNAIFALKARNAYMFVKLMPEDSAIVSLDDAIKVMLETGKDIDSGYKETAEKGLAKLFKEKKR